MAVTRSPADVRLALPPTPHAANRARRALLDAGLSPDLEHTVTLLATEIVANAVRHAGMNATQRIVLLAHMEDDFARVEVYDGGGGFDPEACRDGPGLGLRLVDKLATRWGVAADGGGHVWFEVDRRQRRFDRAPG
jgi:two-component sensor histidine kinase